jgi:hypothetical protein
MRVRSPSLLLPPNNRPARPGLGALMKGVSRRDFDMAGLVGFDRYESILDEGTIAFAAKLMGRA